MRFLIDLTSFKFDKNQGTEVIFIKTEVIFCTTKSDFPEREKM